MSIAAIGSAQSDLVLSSLGIDLWPDYDRPGVLVIYRVTIAPGVTLPARLAFRIPAAVGAPSAVAERQADGQLVTLPYERTVEGEIAIVEVTASRPNLQLEYYDPAISRDGASRSLSFAWRGDYEVGDFSVTVQQPDLAQRFTMDPPATSSGPSVDGLVYHTLTRAGVAVGEVVEVRASYEKATDQLSVETIAPASPPQETGATAGTTGGSETVVIVLAAMLAFAALIVVGLMVRSRQQGTAGPAPAAAGKQPSTKRDRTPGPAAARYCTQCGTAADSADRFCHRCGASLKAGTRPPGRGAELRRRSGRPQALRPLQVFARQR